MLEQTEAIKQIFYFLVLAPMQRGFSKSTLGARDTHAPQRQLCPPSGTNPVAEGSALPGSISLFHPR